MKKKRRADESRPAQSAQPAQPDAAADVHDRHAEDAYAPAAERGPTIVGIGASAGGLEVISRVLQAMPENPGIAIVLVQHLAPNFESALPALLAGKSRLPVVQVTEGMAVEPNRVYVIPPNVQMEFGEGKLHLVPRPQGPTQHNPIDHFLESLARTCGEHAIGVILSGTASDGARGVQEIKAAGGVTIAQDPETAAYGGMPQAAIATGVVDLVLPPREIAAELARIGGRSYAPGLRPSEAQPETAVSEADLQQIFTMLRKFSGVDFSHYKPPTIRRRLQRRMMLQKILSVERYIAYMLEHPPEVEKLYNDILINVTRFFREPDSFDALRKSVLPEILEQHEAGSAIRVWVPGCATGEEAYSLAIVLLEFLGERAGAVPIQVFATDVSEPAIERAREGTYPPSIESDVSPERLRRFFTRVDGNYRISKTVRECCIFARQDLTRDPPFSKLDLVMCRNVLIYLSGTLQRKLMSIFHYALRPWGFLMLGAAETVGLHMELYTVIDKRHRIYRKKPMELPPNLMFPAEYSGLRLPQPRRPQGITRTEGGVQSEANRFILERYAPPAVIVDEDFQIIHFRGQTGAYLEPAPGDASLNLLKMAREGLLYGLRAAITEARQSGKPAVKENLKVSSEGAPRTVGVEVVPLRSSGRQHFLVLFTEPDPLAREAPAPRITTEADPGSEQERLAALERELAASREYLQSVIQDLEAANEELQSANEEILSSNEELQSTNEELDTAKEELQSTNEELNTLNEELHARNEEMSRVNSDLVNLLSSVNIAIVMVAADLRIRRFTPMAEKVLNLIPSDIGRPISHVKPNIDCPELEKIIIEVIDTMSTQEREVRDRQGNWFSLRVRPYKNVEHRIDGAVLALIDITAAKEYLTRARDYAEAVVETAPSAVVVLDTQLRVTACNRAFRDLLGIDAQEVRGELFVDLCAPRGSAEEFGGRLREVVERGASVERAQFERDAGGGRAQMLSISARRLPAAAGRETTILLGLQEVTGQGDRTDG